MQHIGKSIKKLLKKNGLEKGIAQQNAIDIWPEVVGSQLSEKTKATEIAKYKDIYLLKLKLILFKS